MRQLHLFKTFSAGQTTCAFGGPGFGVVDDTRKDIVITVLLQERLCGNIGIVPMEETFSSCVEIFELCILSSC